jgi:methylglyoxal synthase
MMSSTKRTALIADGKKKKELLAWLIRNRGMFRAHRLWATGTIGGIAESCPDLPITRLESGPLGGDQQVGQ